MEARQRLTAGCLLLGGIVVIGLQGLFPAFVYSIHNVNGIRTPQEYK